MNDALVSEATYWHGSLSLALLTSIVHYTARASTKHWCQVQWQQHVLCLWNLLETLVCYMYLFLTFLSLFHLSEWHPSLWRRQGGPGNAKTTWVGIFWLRLLNPPPYHLPNKVCSRPKRICFFHTYFEKISSCGPGGPWTFSSFQ